jgi:replicative DNA helicase
LENGLPIEPVSVGAAIRDGDNYPPEVEAAGGKVWVGELLDNLEVLPAALPGHVQTLKDLHLRRMMTRELQAGLAKVANCELSPAMVLAEVSGTLAGMTRETRSVRGLPQIVESINATIEKAATGEDLPAISTGLASLDAIIGGLQRSVLTIVAADTGVGKSSFLATIGRNCAVGGTRVGVFSLEDEGEWLGYRLLSKESNVSQADLRFRPETLAKGRLEVGQEKLEAYAERIFIDDRPGLKPEEIVISARNMILNHGVEVIVIDHLGEVNVDKVGGKDDRHDLKVSAALSMFRDVAKTHRIPVVCATQVSVSKDAKPGALPGLKDVKNAREISNKARVVLGLGRKPGADTLIIGVLKQTNGAAGEILELPFIKGAAMVEDKDTRQTEFPL